MKTPPAGVLAAFLMLNLTVNGFSAGPNHPAQESVEGDVIVTFKPGVNLPAAEGALSSHSLGFRNRFAILSGHRRRETGLVHAGDRTTAQLIAQLSRDPMVETAEPNYLRWVSSALPNDTLFTNLWGLKNTGQPISGTAGTAGDDIHFVTAWSLAQPSAANPPVVGVIDSGVDYTHPDLAGNMWINVGEIPGNGVDDDGDGLVDDYYGYDFADGLPDPADSGFHGTHVAGTIGAIGNNQLGVIGVDYQARIMALRASNDGDSLPDSAIIDAIQYATMMKNRGVNIVAINESFGGGGFNSAERDAMQAAGDAGIIFCVAAGNETNNNDAIPTYPANYGLTNMIVVAATDQNDALANFSNYGTNSVDIGAPGVNILSTLPVAQAGTIASVTQSSTTYSANELTFSGTTTGITATVYYCGLGNSGDFPPAVQNNIALIQRGTLLFSDKVANAMAVGARAVIIYNNTNGNFFGTLGATNNWIPAVSLSQADGLAMQTNAPATVINAPDPSQIYQYLAGTSMATPHVAGAVAFAAQNFPSETMPQRIQRVLINADVVPGLQSKVHNGRRLNLQRIVDADTNGLPDWWELQYFGHLTGTGPNADPDHDGLGNLAEWVAGTNPTNAASSLRLAVSSASNSNGVMLRWPSIAGKTYRLERATNLLTGFLSTVRTNIAATAPTNTETDATIFPGNARYYRVGVEQ